MTHPVVPSAEQLKEWEDAWFDETEHVDVLLIKAFQAGADQELNETIEWLSRQTFVEYSQLLRALRNARRPPPPLSLKQKALHALASADGPEHPKPLTALSSEQHDIIRQALESLPND